MRKPVVVLNVLIAATSLSIGEVSAQAKKSPKWLMIVSLIVLNSWQVRLHERKRAARHRANVQINAN